MGKNDFTILRFSSDSLSKIAVAANPGVAHSDMICEGEDKEHESQSEHESKGERD